MALLGQGAYGVPIDYSAVGDSAWKLAAANSGAAGMLAGTAVDITEKRQEYKDQIKTGKELAKAMKVLYPELATIIDPALSEIENPELNLRQQAGLASNAGTLINAYMGKMRDDRNYNLDLAADNRAQDEHNVNMDAVAKAMAERDRVEAEQRQSEAFIAPERLKSVLRHTAELEKGGYEPLISSAKLQEALNAASPSQQSSIVAAALAGLPQPVAEQINYDTPATINGQPGKIATAYNPQTGRMREIPIDSAPSELAPMLPVGLAPYAADFEAAGAKYGVDPRVLAAISMHETGNGTSSAFRNKNNAMGVSNASGPVAMDSIPASIEKMAALLGSTNSGPYKNAQTVGDVAGIYAPVGAGNDPNNLNQHWTNGVTANIKRLGGDPTAPIRIQPGASTAKQPVAQTPAQARKEQLEVEKMEREAAESGQKAVAAAAESSARVKKLADVADKYTTKGKDGARAPNKRLRDVTGPFAAVGKVIDKYADPKEFTDKGELQRFVENDLLEATKDLKPVSEDEMKLLMSRRPVIDSPPEAWAQYMDEVLKFIASKSPGSNEQAAVPDASMFNNRFAAKRGQ